MPKSKDLKRLVRSRMKKTGEAYTTARSHVLAKKGTPTKAPDFAAVAGMSDDAVAAKTGKTWRQWVATLDAIDAASMPHRDIAAHLRGMGVPAWWSQMVTVGYERIRGLREKGQRRGGGFDVNKSKTYPVAIGAVYEAFRARQRRQWLGDHEVTVKKASVEKSMRLTWEDGTPVEVYFWSKGRAKTQVQLQHRKLSSKAEAVEVRRFWAEKLESLGAHLAARA